MARARGVRASIARLSISSGEGSGAGFAVDFVEDFVEDFAETAEARAVALRLLALDELARRPTLAVDFCEAAPRLLDFGRSLSPLVRELLPRARDAGAAGRALPSSRLRADRETALAWAFRTAPDLSSTCADV